MSNRYILVSFILRKLKIIQLANNWYVFKFEKTFDQNLIGEIPQGSRKIIFYTYFG